MSRVRRPTAQRCGARDFQSTASFSECPTSEDSRCAAFYEVVHARGRGQPVCVLCECDDLVQAPAHSWTFVHQHRPGRYAGRSVQAHSGTPPSNECNLPKRATSRRIVDVATSGPQAVVVLWGLGLETAGSRRCTFSCGQPVTWCKLSSSWRHESGRRT